MNRVQNELDLWFCDASSGASHVVLHEQSNTWITRGQSFPAEIASLILMDQRAA